MGIEFENIYKDRVIDTIQKLLKQNLASIPIVFDEHRGQESFLIIPDADTFIDYASNVHIREFTTVINYQLRKGGEYTKENQLNRLTMIAEVVKRLLFDNRNSLRSSSVNPLSSISFLISSRLISPCALILFSKSLKPSTVLRY